MSFFWRDAGHVGWDGDTDPRTMRDGATIRWAAANCEAGQCNNRSELARILGRSVSEIDAALSPETAALVGLTTAMNGAARKLQKESR